jgi:hypothetical protein
MSEPLTTQPRRGGLTFLLAVAGAMIALGLMQKGQLDLPAISISDSNTEDVVRESPDGASGDEMSTNNFIQSEKMLPGQCFAGSPIEDAEALGGFGTSDNMPNKVAADSGGKGLYLLAEPAQEMSHGDQPFMRLVLVNQTASPVAFPAQDSRLSIIQESQDAQGNWQPIEYLMSAWCGNSHHKVTLPAGQFWEFPVPRYQGTLETKLRFTYLGEDGKNIHSNEFEGKISPSQLVLPGELREIMPHGIINATAYQDIGPEPE